MADASGAFAPEIRHGLYELVGGREGFHRLVAAMHERVIRDDILGPLFADADHLVPVTEFFVGAFGGEGDPAGLGALCAAHHGRQLTEVQRRRYVQQMMASADDSGFPDAPEVRAVFAA